MGQRGDKIASLKRHMKLEMRDIFAKVFAHGRVGKLLRRRNQSVLPLKSNASMNRISVLDHITAKFPAAVNAMKRNALEGEIEKL